MVLKVKTKGASKFPFLSESLCLSWKVMKMILFVVVLIY